MSSTPCPDCGGVGGAHAEGCGMVMSVEPGSERAKRMVGPDRDATQEPTACVWCGRTYEQHRELPYGPGEARPRTPCLELRSGFQSRRLDTPPRLAEVRPLANPPNEEVVKYLAELLARAKSGEIRGVVAIWTEIGATSGNMSAGEWDGPHALYAFECWKARMIEAQRARAE